MVYANIRVSDVKCENVYQSNEKYSKKRLKTANKKIFNTQPLVKKLYIRVHI